MTNSSIEVSFAPYASPNSVISVIHRLRDVGLPDPLTLDGLSSVGVPPTMVGPTLRSLKFLGLVDDDGQQLPTLQHLKVATSDDYPTVLAEIIQTAYSDVFTIVDPAKHGFDQVLDAFRPYIPQKQRRKMVRLFLGLCEEASLASEQPKRRRSQRATRVPTRMVDTTKSDLSPMPSQGPAQVAVTPVVASTPANGAKSLISSFVAQLPDSGVWTADHRERWLQAVKSTVDLMISVSDSAEDDP